MSVELGESEKRKSKTMYFCDKTKCGVDVANQMARQYSVKADTHRWLVAVFDNMLNLAGINAFGFYTKQTADKVSKRDCLFKLATEPREDCILKKSSRNATVARPHSLSRTSKKNQTREA